MCESLSNSLAAFSKNCRKNIKDSEDIGDLVTLDIMTEIARGTDKWLWFVEAHLQISEQSGNPS
jgi:starvation-inducible DNA-binding protein